MKRYAVRHETHYTYSLPVDIGQHVARLSPVTSISQRLIEHTLDVTPTPTWAMAFNDHFGNGLHHFAIETAHTEFAVVQRTLVEVTAPSWTVDSPAPAWETVRDGMQADAFPEYPEAAEFIYASPLVPIDATATAYACLLYTSPSPRD